MAGFNATKFLNYFFPMFGYWGSLIDGFPS
jgi:hypothetical protein